MDKSVLLVAILFLVLFKSHAQDVNKEYVPPTPTAASLGKYVDVPVNLATGVPNINLPIYEIRLKDVRIPISLSYHAGGFRVSEGASWVGLGWSLNAGGVVTKSIRHLEDNGTYQTNFSTRTSEYLDQTKQQDFELLVKLVEGFVDGLPDLYTYNFNGYSGKFLWGVGDNNLMPASPLVVKSVTGSEITIIGYDGIKYYFQDTENALSRTSTSANNVTSSYFLSKIETPLGEVVNFIYKSTEFYQSIDLSSTATYRKNAGGYWDPLGTNESAVTSKLNGKALERITFSQGEIIFNSTYDRLDVSKPQGAQGDVKLNNIEIKDNSGKLLKKILFNYDYFNSSSTDVFTKRLKLISIEEINDSPGAFLHGQVHKFDYNENVNLPSRLSKARDHWGYYNGKEKNRSLVPNLVRFSTNCSIESGSVDLSTRESDERFLIANVLNKVTYPTGGYSLLEYEGNSYPTSTQEYNIIEGSVDVPSLGFDPNHEPTPGDIPEVTLYEKTSSTFTLNSSTCVNVFHNIFVPENADPHGEASVLLFKKEGNTFSAIQNWGRLENGTDAVYLLPGTYYLKVVATYTDSWARADYYYHEFKPNTALNKTVGGLRVSKITQHDLVNPTNDIVKKYLYTVFDHPSISSGVIIQEPSYTEGFKTIKPKVDPDHTGGSACLTDGFVENMRVSSESLIPLGSGNHIVYSTVTVLEGNEGENGKTISTFTTYENPSREHSDAGWRRGQLLTEVTFNAHGDTIKEIINEYYPSAFLNKVRYGTVITDLGKHPCASTCCDYPRWFGQHPAVMISEHRYLGTTTERIYNSDNLNEFIENRTDYKYENGAHLQISKVIQIDSYRNRKITQNLYPADYKAGSSFTDTLQLNYIHNIPIETVQYEEDSLGTNRFVIGGKITTFKRNNLRKDNWAMEISRPVPMDDFRFSNQTIAGLIPNGTNPGIFSKGTQYNTKVAYNAYDNNRNLIQYTLEKSEANSFIWGYEGKLLVAEAKNAKSNQVYYTSFEEKGIPLDNAFSGRKVNLNEYSFIPPSDFSPKLNSVLSYWKLEANNWVYHEQSYSGGSVTITGTIDEFRIAPKGATIKTYTYDPLIGVTTVLDQNSLPVYYKYDALGRLIQILDHDKKLLKQINYHYSLSN